MVASLRARLASGVALSSADALDEMRESYRNYVRDNTPSFRALFAHLIEDRAPLVIHCTAGKDRTGFLCAMLLFAVDVPRESVYADYLLRANMPLVYGLSNITCEAQREAAFLAELLGGVIDSHTSL